ncbi:MULTISPECIES: aminoglycoside phosphotransferase family protein [unclassified Dietzia]|uniref:aminoglycoside phosphotransferase family protein n=1 Tax=unclassified Dietzia TaxID=2617939 RepID=UPI0015FA3069|nr:MULTISPECIES: aminoglycoside phosphotransferase family protein [unclassified Dietzia]MBB1024149.1 aminoglycoside phosphotransferase family protein [Dietzia sp. DQ12-76]MBB1026181.1 aminoglycoside phosphotransferase family protein [Dietzia sp. DQ11-38-2]
MATLQAAPPGPLKSDPTLADPPPTMASPNWWGADSIRFRATDASGRSVFVKSHTTPARSYIDIPSAIRATRAAGEAGLGPVLLGVDPDSGQLALEDLTDSHKTATLADFRDPGSRADYFRTRSLFRAVDDPGLRQATVFDDVRALHDRIAPMGTVLPGDIGWMHERIVEIGDLVSALGFDAVPVHGDANCSNVALGSGGQPTLLLDFDWAALADPLQDVGSVLLEFSYSEYDGRELFEEAWGAFDDGLYARARLYSVAEAYRSALVGVLADSLDPGTQEYSKFSDWMFLRARAALTARTTDDHMRMAR